jgi:hypothetical protein
MNFLKTSQIDSLSKVQRLFAWAGISLIAVLVIALVSRLFADTFNWSEAIPLWIILSAAGFWGSEYRNRRLHRT